MGLFVVFFSLYFSHSLLPSLLSLSVCLSDGRGKQHDSAIVISVPQLLPSSLLPYCWWYDQHHQPTGII